MGGVLSNSSQQPPGEVLSEPQSNTLARNTTRSYLSYFISKPTPDLTHTHARPAGPATIIAVTRLLALKGLPLEIAQRVVDEARYWSRCTRTNKKPCTVLAGMLPPRQPEGGERDRWTSGQEEELRDVMDREGGLKDGVGTVWYLASSPIGCGPAVYEEHEDGAESERGPREETGVWVRQIAVETFSRDQGWSDDGVHYGTYEASYSWFELSLLRDGLEVPKSCRKIQYNIHAGQYFKSHHNVLDQHHPLVMMAKEGDRVVLWVRAEFPGWRNSVKEATITIHTAPFPTP